MSHWDPLGPLDPSGSARTAEVYFGPSAQPDPDRSFGCDAPQAFLVEMGAGCELRTHYHPVDQYQVFVSGSGRFGRHEVEPGTVHYSDANTPYGPLVSGERGVGFLTLRGRTDSGAFYMPESREDLRTTLTSGARPAERRRNRTFAELASWSQPGWRWSHDDPDGVRVGRLLLEPRSAAIVPEVTGAGAYLVVWRGVVEFARSLEVSAGGSLVWLAPNSSQQLATAGGDGATVLMLQLPSPLPAFAGSVREEVSL